MAGMDMMLNALLNYAGLDSAKIKEIAAKIASDDTLNKVMAFSREIERQNNLLEEIRDELRSQRAAVFYPGPRRSEPGRIASDRTDSVLNGSIAD